MFWARETEIQSIQVVYSNAQLADWLCWQIKSSRIDLQVLHTADGTPLEQVLSTAVVMQSPGQHLGHSHPPK